MMLSFLGIAAYHFNPAASLVYDGELVAVCEEEKLLQDKRTQAFPVRSIRSCLAMRGLSPRDINAFVIDHDQRTVLSTSYLRYALDLVVVAEAPLRFLIMDSYVAFQ